ncbi:MAG: hypothetical protein HQL11_04155 [Candidatus Omnitrophica bacterium]|nr:hypothetical protein [Candidatus Omnitrophota bacterium]
MDQTAWKVGQLLAGGAQTIVSLPKRFEFGRKQSRPAKSAEPSEATTLASSSATADTSIPSGHEAYEELLELLRDERARTARLEDRLSAMTESIMTIQARLGELSARGTLNPQSAYAAIQSVSAAERLGEDEQTLLANIFRQNLAIQKPELASNAHESK